MPCLSGGGGIIALTKSSNPSPLKSQMIRSKGTFGKISDCQPEVPGFSACPASLRIGFWATFFRHNARGQGRIKGAFD